MTRTETQAPAPSRRIAGPGGRGEGAGTLVTVQQPAPRGLKAGRSALVHARSAYGEAQWSGDHDRRPEPGLLVRTRL